MVKGICAIHGYPCLCNLKILIQKSTSEIDHISHGEDEMRKIMQLWSLRHFLQRKKETVSTVLDLNIITYFLQTKLNMSFIFLTGNVLTQQLA